MITGRRAFLTRFSRILRKSLNSKSVVDCVMHRTLARATHRMFNLYPDTGDLDAVPNVRVDPGEPVVRVIPCYSAMEANLRRYEHGLEVCLEPGFLRLTADVRADELTDCKIRPWLG